MARYITRNSHIRTKIAFAQDQLANRFEGLAVYGYAAAIRAIPYIENDLHEECCLAVVQQKVGYKPVHGRQLLRILREREHTKPGETRQLSGYGHHADVCCGVEIKVYGFNPFPAPGNAMRPPSDPSALRPAVGSAPGAARGRPMVPRDRQSIRKMGVSG